MAKENNFNSKNNFSKNKNNERNLFILSILTIICIALFFTATYLKFYKYLPENNNKQIATQEVINYKNNKTLAKIEKVLGWSLTEPVFAEYIEIKNSVKPGLQKIGIKTQDIENLNSFKEKENIDFSNEQKQALENYGFFLADNNIIKSQENGTDDFVDMYNNFDGISDKYYREPQDAVFITSDAALHLYHILIDRSFQKIEEVKFQPMLRIMTKALFLDSINNYNTTTDISLKESYKRLSAYYLIPLVVLDTGSKLVAVDVNPSDYKTLAQYMDVVSQKKIKNSTEKLEFSLDSAIYENVSYPQYCV